VLLSEEGSFSALPLDGVYVIADAFLVSSLFFLVVAKVPLLSPEEFLLSSEYLSEPLSDEELLSANANGTWTITLAGIVKKAVIDTMINAITLLSIFICIFFISLPVRKCKVFKHYSDRYLLFFAKYSLSRPSTTVSIGF
jgi:hypothetical protein